MNPERILKIILSPHTSEKSARGTEKNREYVFEVSKSASKAEIKAAFEHLFNTKVDDVRVLNVKSKDRRFGQIMGKKKAWKKAYITLTEGQQPIDIAGSIKG